MVRKKDENSARYNQLEEGADRAKPVLHQHAREIQPFGKIARLPIALKVFTTASKIPATTAAALKAVFSKPATTRLSEVDLWL